ncbi:sulfite exporter TauE/SafE family protein [Aurantibacillus circumpalustris]|uniref:sulfite exporter TauE/SafE family protein n=1 Tax=Aurantibacillus circumpalustris TaxID=3036359 RepID=UPI00295ABA64|nr:sulfite exporter TauE/SafE family protein [Aurantibacillus circumpalustris]
MITILGFIAFLIIGVILGLIGGGGSILGVPVLVYILNYSAEEATTYSLFIVGLTSLIGAISYLRKGEISGEALYEFALASLVSVFCVRKFVMPAIPDQIHIFNGVISKDILIMVLFSLLILSSSVSMIRKRKPGSKSQVKWDEFARSPLGLPFVILLGIAVGFITGFVGAGGGFIIVPVLIFFLRLNFKKAIGTSLFIIAINSLVGFTGNIGNQEINWVFLISISAMSIVGITLGSMFSGKVSPKKLKPAFGWFTLVVGIAVLVKELVFN